MARHNPFAKPHTPGQWLLGSVSWAMSYLGGWVLLASLLLASMQKNSAQSTTPLWALLIGSAVVSHLLLWWKPFAGVWSWSANTDEWLLGLVVWCWLFVLMLFQIVSLLLLLGAAGVLLGGETSGEGGGWR